MNHQSLTGKSAVHPFAFVQSTDPALDPLNLVTANKAWVDTSASPTLVKIRNIANNAWNTILGASVAQAYLPIRTLSGPFMTAFVLAVPAPLFPQTPTPLTHI